MRRPAGFPPRAPKGKRPPKRDPVAFLMWMFLFAMLMFYFSGGMLSRGGVPKPIKYSELYAILANGAGGVEVTSAVLTEKRLEGKLSDGRIFRTTLPAGDDTILALLRQRVSDFEVKSPGFLSNLFWAILPIMILISFFWFMFYRGSQAGGRIMSFGKSRAKLVAPDKPKVTFNDVAGVDEAKEELREVIEFLKDPKKFQRLGGKMPKGVLLMGPPGCGKTLLAQAVSGEAQVPFLSISGSDFVEMFVGVGASRVRDLFQQARKSAKASGKGCIIFMDEIDAVGRQRFAGIGGGHDEREQTLNALLVEMDGFDTQGGIILMAASNRPDVLDPALLRPGRFDRQIIIDRPDIIGREEILKVHARKIKLDKSVELKRIARQTPGFSGADLANLVNEAALLAARKKEQNTVTTVELEESIERVMAGPQRKSKVINPEEKKIIAYHESGHALLALLIPEADPLHKVSILPRGIALGYTLTPPKEDRHIQSKEKLLAGISVALGGRASEEIAFSEISTGARNDIAVVTEIAREMVQRYGMSEKLGNVAFGRKHEAIFLGRDFGEERNYSEETARLIDQEIKRIVDGAYKRSKDLLKDNKEKLDKLASALLEKEVLDDEEVKSIVGIFEG